VSPSSRQKRGAASALATTRSAAKHGRAILGKFAAIHIMIARATNIFIVIAV
jgi:hypothetical protein